jgi:hypothetical protein
MRTVVLGSVLLACLSFPAPHTALAAPNDTTAAAESRRMADRFFRVKVNVYGRDDETWPETDENINRDYGPFESVLGDANRDFHFHIPHTGWGDECRVEVLQTKAHLRDDGSIEVTGTARLFEGIGEDSDQLRDEEFFTVIVPRKTENQYHQIHLNWSGGDFADVKFWLTNIVNE